MNIKVCYRHNKAEVPKGNWISGDNHDITDDFVNATFTPHPCPECETDPRPKPEEFHVLYCQFHGKLRSSKSNWVHVENNPPAGFVRQQIQKGCKKLVVLHPANCYVCLGGLDKQKRDQDFEDGKSH